MGRKNESSGSRLTAEERNQFFELIDTDPLYGKLIKQGGLHLRQVKKEGWEKLTEKMRDLTGKPFTSPQLQKVYHNRKERMQRKAKELDLPDLPLTSDLAPKKTKPARKTKKIEPIDQFMTFEDEDSEPEEGTGERLNVNWVEHNTAVLDAFTDFWEESKYFDTTIVCDQDYKIEAHKAVLASFSPVFKEMIDNGPRSHLLNFRNLSGPDLENVLDYMYTGKAMVAKKEMNAFLNVARSVEVQVMNSPNSESEVPPLKTESEVKRGTISEFYSDMRNNGENFDITIVCSNNLKIQAHKAILYACSSFFKEILKVYTQDHPILSLRYIKRKDLRRILDYMYRGRAVIAESELSMFLSAAGKLQVKGLHNRLPISSESGAKKKVGKKSSSKKKKEWEDGETSEEDFNEEFASNSENEEGDIGSKKEDVSDKDFFPGEVNPGAVMALTQDQSDLDFHDQPLNPVTGQIGTDIGMMADQDESRKGLPQY